MVGRRPGVKNFGSISSVSAVGSGPMTPICARETRLCARVLW